MKRHFEKGASHVEIFAVVAVIALAGVLTFVYYNKSQELASKPATTKTAVQDTRQVKKDLESINIDAELDMSEIDAVLQ